MIVALFIKSRITDFELHLRHHDIGDFTYSTDMKNFLSYLSVGNQFIITLMTLRDKMKGPVCREKNILLYLCSRLLSMSYAPEPTPGPWAIKYPCAICEKAVRWNTPGVCCDSCDQWYHQQCLECMTSFTNHWLIYLGSVVTVGYQTSLRAFLTPQYLIHQTHSHFWIHQTVTQKSASLIQRQRHNWPKL